MITLQQKIDNAFRNRVSEHWTAHQIDKALQEFREQIKGLYTLQHLQQTYQDHPTYVKYVELSQVLELIGEQK